MRDLNAVETAEMENFFTVQRSSGLFTATSMDQTIEQTVNKQCKTTGGIKGVTLNQGEYNKPSFYLHTRQECWRAQWSTYNGEDPDLNFLQICGRSDFSLWLQCVG